MRQLLNILTEANITQSPGFRAWFGNSKVVDHQGQPLVVYHGSFNSIDAFHPGTHFGDQGAANDRIDSTHGDRQFTSNHGVIYPVYLSIKNPLRVFDDGGLRDGMSTTRSPRMSHIDHDPDQNSWDKDTIEGFEQFVENLKKSPLIY